MMLSSITIQSSIFGLIVVIFLIFNIADSSIDPVQEAKCLNCIRNVSTLLGVDVMKRCEGYYCGQYQISYTYWAEAGKPGNNQGARDYEKCARDKVCAEQTVKAYFKKFKRDCNNDGVIDCLDMAALHKAGPTSCSSDWFYKSRFWVAFNKTSCVTNRNDSPDGLRSSSDDAPSLRPINSLMKNQSLTPECLDCICDAVSGCNTSVNNCGSGTVCGPFAISQAYWKDGRKPGASWTACARTKDCSSVTIKNYMEKYKKDCNDDGYITCEDYAAIHRRGPRACSNKDLLKDHYWNKFLACRANQKPLKDVNMVKVGEAFDEASKQGFLASRESPNPSTLSPTQTPTADQASSVLSHEFQSSLQSTNSPSTTTSVESDSHNFGGNNIKYEYSQTPTHDLTLIVQEDNVSRASTNKPNLQPFNQHQHHAQQQRHNNYHHLQPPQNEQLGTNKHKVTNLNADRLSESSQEYRPQPSTMSNFHETTYSRKPSIDYDVIPIVLNPKPASSGSGNGLLTTLATTTMTPMHPMLEHSQPSATTDSLTSSSALVETLPIMTRHHPAESFNHGAENANPANLHEAQQPQQAVKDNSQLVANFPLYDQTIPVASPGEEIDYSMPDFALSPQGQGGDRVNSFDKVVIGIVGSPDFTKSYPPVPDLVQGKQPDQVHSSGEISNQQPTKSKQNMNTNHSRSPSQSSKIAPHHHQQQQQQQQSAESVQKSTSSIKTSNQTSSSSLSQSNNQVYHPRSTLNHQHTETNESDNQPILGPVLGSESMNMSILFEKGLNESSRIASECLECICDASSNCDTTVQCISKQREKNRCGLYMISWNQYQESDISLTSLVTVPAGVSEDSADEKMYYECTTDRVCAEKLINLYIEKHQKDCNNDGRIDCYDVAAIHRVGPENCNSGKFLGSQYWKDFNICYASDRSTTTTQSQAVP